MKIRLPALLFVAALLPATLAADPVLEGRKLYLKARVAVSDGRYREASISTGR